MGAPLEDDGRRIFRLEQGRQQGLGDEGDGAGAAGLGRHIEKIASLLKRLGPESKFLAAQFGPGDLRPADPGQGLNRSEVLRSEPRLGAPGPQPFDPNRHSR